MPKTSHKHSHINSAKESQIATVQRLRKLSHILDNAIPIPGTPYRIGIDPILGILPAGGDIAAAFISGYIIYSAMRLGLPKETLLRMVTNILIDVLIGSIPLLGDVIDVMWKANVKNVELLESHLDIPQESKKADRWFIFLLLAGLFLVVLLVATFGILVINLIVKAVITG
ncbi:MAG: DUF4112 domain-containing protein [Oscillatoriaceae bacterium SKW80]|nr:DUF4112 domain-containing protein [Oscillatoriaceae bacterium SKYG93]MCX8119869.1 DUF4112 domain-containing protein [Oscillatoriaceae bacterium SKW80]MDW8452025.1 DUF4112 domain-containing protein [Oscillatoriaceae cyanobacterium SKYGB_i_bin93]HIK27534.1 DUF4112 domain-containing protein [Oscillatoriaceae cyanobacterium M7585_C2015_266]